MLDTILLCQARSRLLATECTSTEFDCSGGKKKGEVSLTFGCRCFDCWTPNSSFVGGWLWSVCPIKFDSLRWYLSRRKEQKRSVLNSTTAKSWWEVISWKWQQWRVCTGESSPLLQQSTSPPTKGRYSAALYCCFYVEIHKIVVPSMKGGLYVLLADFCRDGHLLVLGRFVRIKWKVVV